MQRTAEEGSRIIRQEMREQVWEIKKRTEEVMQMCKQKARAGPRHTNGKETEDLEEVKRRWHKWALAIQKLKTYAESRNNDSRVQIERAAFPSIDGIHKSWPEFRRLFKALMKASRQNKVLKLAQLRAKLPAQALESIAVTTEPDKVWRLLDKRYRNKNIAIISATATAAENTVQSEALSAESRSGPQVTEGGSDEEVLHTRLNQEEEAPYTNSRHEILAQVGYTQLKLLRTQILGCLWYFMS